MQQYHTTRGVGIEFRSAKPLPGLEYTSQSQSVAEISDDFTEEADYPEEGEFEDTEQGQQEYEQDLAPSLSTQEEPTYEEVGAQDPLTPDQQADQFFPDEDVQK